MQRQLSSRFYEENCKKNILDQTWGCIPFKGAIRIQMQMNRVCNQYGLKCISIENTFQNACYATISQHKRNKEM